MKTPMDDVSTTGDIIMKMSHRIIDCVFRMRRDRVCPYGIAQAKLTEIIRLAHEGIDENI